MTAGIALQLAQIQMRNSIVYLTIMEKENKQDNIEFTANDSKVEKWITGEKGKTVTSDQKPEGGRNLQAAHQ
mgnify:CR=1 FL=1